MKTHVEAWSNTSIVTLRVVGGDEKGSLKFVTAEYGRESQETLTRERLRWQVSAAYTKKRQTRPLVREGAQQTFINISKHLSRDNLFSESEP
jgi:hypothetical protein